jgi:hypothetical protein
LLLLLLVLLLLLLLLTLLVLLMLPPCLGGPLMALVRKSYTGFVLCPLALLFS